MDLVALMPWWVGAGLAVVGYVVLHRLAVPPAFDGGVPPPGYMVRVLVAGIAFPGQYVVPILCCFGALLSFQRRRRRAALLASAAESRDAIALMSWQEFELLVGEAYRLQGFSVEELGGGGADGGVDLVLRRGGDKVFVQCKHWKSARVGVAVVRELFGVMTARGASAGIVVTAGRFTPEARTFARESKVRLVDGDALGELLWKAKAARRGTGGEPPAFAETVPQLAAEAPLDRSAVPSCPVCQSGMVRRTAGKGPNAGQAFWGCSQFPVCRGTR